MSNKKIYAVFTLIVFLTLSVITGCGGVSEEEMAELDALRAETKSLEAETNSLKTQKAELEKTIADKNAKLDDCSKLKSETKANLEKIGM